MGYRDRSLYERQSKLSTSLRDGHVEIAYPSTGLTLFLTSPSSCDFNKEPGKVHLTSSQIVNGICVRWRGWLDLVRLDGMGRLEFDEDLARLEMEKLQKLVQENARL